MDTKSNDIINFLINFNEKGKLNSQIIEVSIIIPVKDEADNINRLSDEINNVMEQQPWSWECVWVNDGSIDQSLAILQELTEKDPHHRHLSFEHNAGQSAALWAGFKESRGIYLATLDGDAQNDPSDIPFLVNLLRSNEADMVNGYRSKREDNLMRKLASGIGNGFRNWITGRSARDVGCSTRAFKRKCVNYLPLFAGMHRFLPTLVAMQGYRLLEVPVNHRPRLQGKTKYTINNRLWVGLADIIGILWLQKRSFHYKIVKKS